jgi:hypothetical protein
MSFVVAAISAVKGIGCQLKNKNPGAVKHRGLVA